MQDQKGRFLMKYQISWKLMAPTNAILIVSHFLNSKFKKLESFKVLIAIMGLKLSQYFQILAQVAGKTNKEVTKIINFLLIFSEKW